MLKISNVHTPLFREVGDYLIKYSYNILRIDFVSMLSKSKGGERVCAYTFLLEAISIFENGN